MLLTADDVDFRSFVDEPTTHGRVQTAPAFRDSLRRELFDKAWGNRGARLPWTRHDKIRFRGGEVTLWLGLNGHGKSLLSSQVIFDFVAQGQKAVIASMEMRPEITLKRMLKQTVASEHPSEEQTDQWLAFCEDRLWVYDQMGTVDRNELLAIIRYCRKKLGVQHFVVDSLLKCGIAEDAYTDQKKFVDALCTVARDFDIHIHLIHHSRKLGDETQLPGKMDARGSGTITDQVDQCLTVWRAKAKEADKRANREVDDSKPDALLVCDKNRHGEFEGKIGLWFTPGVGLFHDTHERIATRYDLRVPVDV